MRLIKNPPPPQEGGMVAGVSFSSGSGFGVAGASALRGLPVFAPRGISYLPGVGDNLLILPIEGRDVCVGALSSPAGLQPGELRLASAGGASIHLLRNGDVQINGVTITRDGRILSN